MKVIFPAFSSWPERSGFSLIELLVVLAVLTIGLGWGLRQWTRHAERQALEQQVHRSIERWVEQGAQLARSEGQVVRLRVDGDRMLSEVGESAFSTQWRRVSSVPVPDHFRFESGESLLLLPHGRPADSVQWRFVHSQAEESGSSDSTVWLLLFFLSGELEWERDRG